MYKDDLTVRSFILCFFILLTASTSSVQTADVKRSALSGQHILANDRVGNNVQTIKLIGVCRQIIATGKRRQSWLFIFKVISVIEGRYGEPFIGFERYQGGPYSGEELLEVLGVREGPGMGEVRGFDRSKEIELIIELRPPNSRSRYILKEFKVKS